MQKITKHTNWQEKLHEIIYEADTPAGKLFDVILLVVILLSVIVVMMESVKPINAKYHNALDIIEWLITILFTIEYIARLSCVKKPWRYVFSFYGIIDLLSTLPKYISYFFAGTHAFAALRALRLLRVFRILKLAHFIGESKNLTTALIASRAKIFVFLFAVLIVSVILGTVMYMVEGEENGFTSIPRSVYWCIVTLTTVGFGDIAPQTPLGQFIASFVMILGYGIIAVPTGIVSAEYSRGDNKEPQKHHDTDLAMKSCRNCSAEINNSEAQFCYRCGEKIDQA